MKLRVVLAVYSNHINSVFVIKSVLSKSDDNDRTSLG